MNALVKVTLVSLSGASSATALAAVGWAWRSGALGVEGLRQPLFVAWAILIPATMWIVLALSARRLASDRLTLADDHRRHLQGALVFWFAVLTALEAWLAYVYLSLGPPPLDRETFARAAFLLMGVAMAVRGNFVAKLSPPKGDDAPDPGAWTRSMLATGWAMTLIGAAMVAGAIFLPVRALVLTALPIFVALLAVAGHQRRALRTAQDTR